MTRSGNRSSRRAKKGRAAWAKRGPGITTGRGPPLPLDGRFSTAVIGNQPARARQGVSRWLLALACSRQVGPSVVRSSQLPPGQLLDCAWWCLIASLARGLRRHRREIVPNVVGRKGLSAPEECRLVGRTHTWRDAQREGGARERQQWHLDGTLGWAGECTHWSGGDRESVCWPVPYRPIPLVRDRPCPSPEPPLPFPYHSLLPVPTNSRAHHLHFPPLGIFPFRPFFPPFPSFCLLVSRLAESLSQVQRSAPITPSNSPSVSSARY